MSEAPAPPQDGGRAAPDLAGDHYRSVLARIHGVLKPQTYLEIGSEAGESLALSKCRAIAVDPAFRFTDPDVVRAIVDRPFLSLHQTTSDRFFAEQDPVRIFGAPVDLAFLDGMHRCEFLLRDFMNTERCCKPNSIIALHDCIPVEAAITSRIQGQERSSVAHRSDWWAGDVWRTALLLKRKRRDLKILALDAAPTGLLLITNLDPGSTMLSEGYSAALDEMFSWTLAGEGLGAYHEEMDIQSTSCFMSDDQITARFWL
jgi:hypothetical protein